MNIMKKTAYQKKPMRQLIQQSMKKCAFVFFMLVCSIVALAQNIIVKGKVTKEDGQPVAGASVMVKGTSNGTTCNDAGEFQISAPSNSTLVISATDFAPKEVLVNGQTTLNITMTALERTLGEVVVTGYGTTRRKDVTGANHIQDSERIR